MASDICACGIGDETLEGEKSMKQLAKDKYPTNYHSVTVKIKDGDEISGKLNIGEFERVSDMFKQLTHQYIVISDAQHRGASGKVVIVNVSEIVWCKPDQ
jgi:hypothetical protein